jgi:hypothetical protein
MNGLQIFVLLQCIFEDGYGFLIVLSILVNLCQFQIEFSDLVEILHVLKDDVALHRLDGFRQDQGSLE